MGQDGRKVGEGAARDIERGLTLDTIPMGWVVGEKDVREEGREEGQV